MKLLVAILFVLSCSYSFAQVGELMGSVREDSTKKEIPFAKIKVYKNNTLIQETVSDSAGVYKIKNLTPDTVDVFCEADFYFKANTKGVLISANRISFVNFSLKEIKD